MNNGEQNLSVIKVEKTEKTWTGKNGTLDIYNITVKAEDGSEQIGSVMCKQGGSCPFKEGEVAKFTAENTDYGLKFKFTYENSVGGFKGGYGGGKSNNASFALSYAKDVLVADWGGMDRKLNTDSMFALANKMFTWLNERK